MIKGIIKKGITLYLGDILEKDINGIFILLKCKCSSKSMFECQCKVEYVAAECIVADEINREINIYKKNNMSVAEIVNNNNIKVVKINNKTRVIEKSKNLINICPIVYVKFTKQTFPIKQ